MNRTDSSLITGMNGASVRALKAKELREARKLLKAEQRAHLTPVAELVLGEIKKEQEATKLTLLKMVNPSTPEDTVKSLISALNLYDSSLAKLKTRLTNIMRTKGAEDEVED